MSIYKNIRQEAKIDSRRFGKSITCRIVYGPLLDFIESKGLLPEGVFIGNRGLDPINNKCLVIPVTKYDAIYKNFLTVSEVKTTDSSDIEVYETIYNTAQALIKQIKQSMVLVTINHSKPSNLDAGPDPEAYDVLIDSIDVNQAIEGVYVYRNSREAIRDNPKWNRK